MTEPQHEFFIGLAHIFNALHELPDAMPQRARQQARLRYLFTIQGEGEFALLPSEIALVIRDVSVVPDSMGEQIEQAYEALRNRDESHPALIELRRRLGPAQDILDGEDTAKAMRERPYVPSGS
jgi:hypothetical protein